MQYTSIDYIFRSKSTKNTSVYNSSGLIIMLQIADTLEKLNQSINAENTNIKSHAE